MDAFRSGSCTQGGGARARTWTTIPAASIVSIEYVGSQTRTTWVTLCCLNICGGGYVRVRRREGVQGQEKEKEQKRKKIP